MPRYQQKHTITIPRPLFDEIISHCHDPNRRPLHAVLAGNTNDQQTALRLFITDDDTPEERTTKRQVVAQEDLDVVGNASVTYQALDQTIARTGTEQQGRRQTTYSPPEGHVFLHVIDLSGVIVVNANVVHNGKVRQAVVAIDDPEKPRVSSLPKIPPCSRLKVPPSPDQEGKGWKRRLPRQA